MFHMSILLILDHIFPYVLPLKPSTALISHIGKLMNRMDINLMVLCGVKQRLLIKKKLI